jgi:hypothetical protein
MLKCLVRILPKKIVSLPDHNHPLYFNYKTLIRFLQRLMKYKWSSKRKRFLEVLLAKKWPSFPPFAKYFNKLKFISYFEVDNSPAAQQSVLLLLTQAIIEFQPRQAYDNCYQQLCQDMKRISSIKLTCCIKAESNAKILRNFLRSFHAYGNSLYSMRTTYGFTELANLYEDNALKNTFSKIKQVILDCIRYSRRIMNTNQRRRIFRPRHRSSPIYLSSCYLKKSILL